MDIKSISSSDLISICLFNEIIIFANKLIAINTYKNSFAINFFPKNMAPQQEFINL